MLALLKEPYLMWQANLKMNKSYLLGDTQWLVPIKQVYMLQRHIYLKMRFMLDRKSTRLNSSHVSISYAVFCLKKKKKKTTNFNCHRENRDSGDGWETRR